MSGHPSTGPLLGLMGQVRGQDLARESAAIAALGRSGLPLAGLLQSQDEQKDRNYQSAQERLNRQTLQNRRQTFQSEQNVLDRDLRSQLSGDRIAAIASEGVLGRDFTQGQQDRSLTARADIAQQGRTLSRDLQQGTIAAADARAVRGQQFTMGRDEAGREFVREGRAVTQKDRAEDIARGKVERTEDIDTRRTERKQNRDERRAEQKDAAKQDSRKMFMQAWLRAPRAERGRIAAAAMRQGIEIGDPNARPSAGVELAIETLAPSGARPTTTNKAPIPSRASNPSVIRAARQIVTPEEARARAAEMLRRPSIRNRDAPPKTMQDAVIKKLLVAVEEFPNELSSDIVDAALASAANNPSFAEYLRGVSARPTVLPTNFKQDFDGNVYDGAGNIVSGAKGKSGSVFDISAADYGDLEQTAGGPLQLRDPESLDVATANWQNRTPRFLGKPGKGKPPTQTLFVDLSGRNPMTFLKGLERETLLAIVEAARGNK